MAVTPSQDVVIRIATDKVLSEMTRIASDPQQALVLLGNYIHSAAAGCEPASTISVSYAEADGVRASGTVSIDTDLAEDDTLVIEATTLTWKNGFATGTITCANVDADDTVTVGDTTFTFKASASSGTEVTVGNGGTEAATNLAAKINAHATASTVVVATAASAVVNLRAVTTGTGGNSIVLTSSDGTDLAVSGAGNLAGGEAVSSTQVAMAFSDATTIDRSSCATNLAAKINAQAALSAILEASASAEVVTVTANEKGDIGNFIAISETGAGVTLGGSISGGKLGGGVDSTFVTFTR